MGSTVFIVSIIIKLKYFYTIDHNESHNYI